MSGLRLESFWRYNLAAALLTVTFVASTSAAPESRSPRVTRPPGAFYSMVPKRYQAAARVFYKKYIDVNGMPVVSAAEVSDAALQRTYWIVNHLLAGRQDVVTALVKQHMYLIIIGKNQKYTDMPEYSDAPNPDYLNERVRGTGGLPSSFGEENLLCLPIDRYDDESIGVHEFCHTIDSAIRSIDPTWTTRKNKAFRDALAKGLWKNTYVGSNSAEYFAEVSQMYFDCDRPNNWNHGPTATREQLKAYDPETYELIRTTFNLTPDTDWRYTWLQKLPNVAPPPAQFKIDPYYTKFTWAREFTVVGRQATDEALLKANDTVRKIFAYRHDILKALIADGVKLVVLGRKEHIYNLPEFSDQRMASKVDLLTRCFDYERGTKTLVVGEENVLADPNAPYIGGNQVIRVFAKALYEVTGKRPIDPNWDRRGRDVQQYEMRVTRLDIRFDQKLTAIFAEAVEKGLWKGTAAVNDKVSYWVNGVLAYFDANAQDAAPNDAPHSIATREQLKQYDPELLALVNETFAYDGHPDWRFR